MKSAGKVLRESFRLLLDRPKLFVPKVFSTVTASLFLVGILSRARSLSGVETSVLVPAMLGGVFLLTMIGVYSSMMLSHMVKEGSSLIESFSGVGDKAVNVLGATLAILGFGVVIWLVTALGYALFYITGEIIITYFIVISLLLMTLGFSYVSYFLPVTLLEGGVISAIGSSYETSRENKGVVTALLVFSLVLLALAISSTGYLEKLGYAGFVAGRLVSTVVNTYIFTVSPAYYLESSGENFD